jgi:hypothetical protein
MLVISLLSNTTVLWIELVWRKAPLHESSVLAVSLTSSGKEE